MNWTEVISALLLVSNAMYTIFRVYDYFHEKKIHNTMLEVELTQKSLLEQNTILLGKITEIIDRNQIG